MELKSESMMQTLSNSQDESCDYTIKADVYVDNNEFAAARNGQVYAKADNTGVSVAYFSVAKNEMLSVNFQQESLTDEQQLAIFGLIQSFIVAAKAKVNTVTE